MSHHHSDHDHDHHCHHDHSHDDHPGHEHEHHHGAAHQHEHVHKHEHAHHHDAAHQHDHCQHDHPIVEAESTKPTDRDKLVKMVEHWIHHNEEHARSYLDWAKRAHDQGLEDVRSILEQIAGDAQLQTRSFEKIQSILKGAPCDPSAD